MEIEYSLYKKGSNYQESIAQIILNQHNTDDVEETDHPNEINELIEFDDVDFLINQIESQVMILKEGENETNQNFASSLFFIKNATDNSIFLEILGKNMKDIFEEIFEETINLLSQKSLHFNLNFLALHILNNLISNKELFIITEPFAILINNIINKFISQYSIDLPIEYIPTLFECFNLMNNLFSLINTLFDDADVSKYPLSYQNILINFVSLIKQIVLLENICPDILKAAFKTSSALYKVNYTIFIYFVQNEFVPICFNLINNRNPAFLEVAEFLGHLSVNDEPTMSLFPSNFPELFKSLLINEPDEIIDSTIQLILKLSISLSFSIKMLQTPNFCDVLLSLHQSFQIRISSLALFEYMTQYRFSFVKPYLEKLPDLNGFIDYMDTQDEKIIFLTLSIICSIAANADQIINSSIIINMDKSIELIDRISNFRFDDDYSDVVQELACVVFAHIEIIIQNNQRKKLLYKGNS